jgi:hypothetical protein
VWAVQAGDFFRRALRVRPAAASTACRWSRFA